MIQNTKVARNDFVFKDCTIRDVNCVSFVGDDNDSSFEWNASSKCDVSWYSQVIQFQKIGNGLESLKKIFNLQKWKL